MRRSRSRSPKIPKENTYRSRYSPTWGPKENEKDKERGTTATTVPKVKKPDYNPSGKLVEERLKKNGVTLKYDEPTDTFKPEQKWRLHVFKGDEQINVIQLYPKSCYRVGRDPAVSDILIEHESCSKQHAIIQHRQVSIDHGYGVHTTAIRPYIIDLNSTHGTILNEKRIESQRFIQLLPKDIIKFAASTREYVFLCEDD